MTMKRSAVFLLMFAALACDDGSDAANDGSLAGASGISGAGGGSGNGSGTGGMAGGAGTSGSGGMTAGRSGGAAGTMEPPCIAPMGGAPQPTFTWFFENVVPGCAGPPCHSSVAGGGLVFGASKDDAYAQLMMPGMAVNHGVSTNMTNCQDTGLMRVALNDPDSSLLYAKLRTDRDPPCGNRMPTGSALCAPTLEAIRMWIASGAPKN